MTFINQQFLTMVVPNLSISLLKLVNKSFAYHYQTNEFEFLLSPVIELIDQEEKETKKQKNQEEEEKKKKSSPCCKTGDGSGKLVDYSSLPDFLKHNEFILHYYRSQWLLMDAILSIFSVHNETINVWTHLIGFFVFLTLTVRAAAATAATATEQAQAARWPFFVYLCGAMFCLLMSSACHLVSCHSARACYIMLRLDYAGIAALIVTSFYPAIYYSFLCDPHFQRLYLVFITGFGVAAVLVLMVPAFERPEFRAARAGLFVCMAMSGLVPIVHKLAALGHRPEAVLTAVYEAAMGVFYVLGVIVYAARVPERWMPGKFDLAGHSHQLFHVLVIAGAYSHYLAGLVYLRWRDVDACY